MSKVRVLVGTRKGAFVLEADGQRKKWNVSGPHFAGWEIYHVKGSPSDPDRLFASQTSGWFGQIIQRSDDGGKTWHQPGTPPGEPAKTPDGMPKGESNKFAYDASARDRQAAHDAPVVRRFAASVGVQARLASRAVADRPGHGVRGRRGRRALPHHRRRSELEGALGTSRPRHRSAVAAGSRRPVPAHDHRGPEESQSAYSSRSRRPAHSGRMTAARRGSRSTED